MKALYKIKKNVLNLGVLFLLILFGSVDAHASKKEKVYKIYRTLNVKDALGLSNVYGIKASTPGFGSYVEVRVYAKEKYTTGGRDDKAGFLYGSYTGFRGSMHDNRNPNRGTERGSLTGFGFIENGWEFEYTPASCLSPIPILGPLTCILAGGPYAIASSTDYKRRLFSAAITLVNGFGDLGPIDAHNKPLEVVIELELNSSINNVKEISLPGIETLYPQDFVLSVKGINYHIRRAAANTDLDAQNIRYTTDNIEAFNITTSLLSDDENLNYDMAVPRKIEESVFNGLPNDFKDRDPSSFVTNMAVYPQKDHAGKPYFYLISNKERNLFNLQEEGIQQHKSLSLDDVDPIPIFEAKVSGATHTYYLYKVNVNDEEVTRVIIEKIDNSGPFPASNSTTMVTKSPTLDSYNLKMLVKKAIPEDERFMVAWHRGFWRDVPENTLESIAAAKDFLATSDMLELDVSRASDLNDSSVHNYILYHDPFMFRQSSMGPNNSDHQCVDPYDKLLVNSTMLARAKRDELKILLQQRFPDYTPENYENWLKAPKSFSLATLTGLTVRDRFGCLTDIPIPSFDQAINSAKQNNMPIMVDKGWDDIDNIYWHAVKGDYENNVFFKGGDVRNAPKLTKMYGDELFRQIAYTPFYFDEKAEKSSNLSFLQAFLNKEANERWIIPAVELQIKLRVDDGSIADHGFSPKGIQRLLDWSQAHIDNKWIGITQINPTAYNGFDNKIIFMDAKDKPSESNPYSSRWDRRADLTFNVNYLKCDYWTSDRPDIVINFLKAIGKLKQ